MGNKFGRVFFLKDYASYIKDDMVAELTDLNRNLVLSIDVIPIPMYETIREVENRRLGVETNITNWQKSGSGSGTAHSIKAYFPMSRREKMFLCGKS